MARFITKLRYKCISETRIVLVSPLIWVDGNTVYQVPEGFKSDGMSIPKWARWFQEPFGIGLEAGVLHDYLLECPDIDISFLEANDVFDLALKSIGMGWWKRNTLEMACNLNGIFIHGNDKPDNWLENQR